MQLELEVGIGTVGTPLKVELRLKNATFSEEEIRMRILQEGDWDARGRFWEESLVELGMGHFALVFSIRIHFGSRFFRSGQADREIDGCRLIRIHNHL